LVHIKIVTDYSVFVFIDHVELFFGNTLKSRRLNHYSVFDRFTVPVHRCYLLVCSLQTQVFASLNSIEFYLGHSISAIEAWVFSFGKLVHFKNNFLQILSKSSEANSKLLLCLFQVHQQFEKARDYEVTALSVQFSKHLLFIDLALLLLISSFVF